MTAIAVGGTHGQGPLPLPPSDQTANGSGGHLREGTDLTDAQGVFRTTGDRITFFTDGGVTRLVCLENLLLERIVRRLAEDPEELSWNVSGTITEYGQSNYLLLEHATRVQGSE